MQEKRIQINFHLCKIFLRLIKFKKINEYYVYNLIKREMKQGDGPIVLILAPTRELAQQVNLFKEICILNNAHSVTMKNISENRFTPKRKNSEKFII